MALELAPYKINVNTVLPSAITLSADGQGKSYLEAIHEGLTEEEAMARIGLGPEAVKRIPLGRFGLPSDVANLVAFLSSNQSDYITGQVIASDGGRSIAH